MGKRRPAVILERSYARIGTGNILSSQQVTATVAVQIVTQRDDIAKTIFPGNVIYNNGVFQRRCRARADAAAIIKGNVGTNCGMDQCCRSLVWGRLHPA